MRLHVVAAASRFAAKLPSICSPITVFQPPLCGRVRYEADFLSSMSFNLVDLIFTVFHASAMLAYRNAAWEEVK